MDMQLAKTANPQYLTHAWPDLFGDEPQIGYLRSAQLNARTAWADIHRTHERAMGDQTRTEAGRLVKSAQFAKSVLERQRSQFENARKSAAIALRAVQEQLRIATNPPSDPGEAAVFADIRAHLRGMDHGERVTLVNAAMQPGGDKRIVHAAISGPKMIGLLEPELHERYTGQYLCYKLPNEWGLASRLSTALELAEGGQALLETHAKQLIDFEGAEAAARSAVYEAPAAA